MRTIKEDTLPGELTRLVANVLDMPAEDIGFDANLVDELAVDSVMRLEILVVLERAYGVKFAQEDLGRIKSVRDVHDLMLEKAGQPGRAAG